MNTTLHTTLYTTLGPVSHCFFYFFTQTKTLWQLINPKLPALPRMRLSVLTAYLNAPEINLRITLLSHILALI